MHEGTIPKVSSDRVCSSCRCAEYIFRGSQTVGVADGGEVGRHLVSDSSCSNKHTTKSLEQLIWRCGINFIRENTRLMQRKSSFIAAEVGDMLIGVMIGASMDAAYTVDASAV
jgi:hypothetical protein